MAFHWTDLCCNSGRVIDRLILACPIVIYVVNTNRKENGVSVGFFGDVLNGILEGDGSFGQRIRSDNAALTDLYKTTYFDFGLNPLRNLKENQFVPMTVVTAGNKILGFEIHGNIHSPINFLSSGWGSFFHTIAREMPLTKGRVWAYDIRRLDESILIGSAVFPGDEAYRRSEEYLKILRIIGSPIIPPLSRVPAISLSFGHLWQQFGVPDRISVSLASVHPFSDAHMKSVINLIVHNYRQSAPPSVVADYTWNPLDGTLELVMRDEPAVAPTATPEPQTTKPEDNFPYDFYRGLGLIDGEDMVEVPSMLGSIRVPMVDPWAKEHLLAYNPEN